MLRPGMNSQEEIEAVIGPIGASSKIESPRVPGNLAAHYAPLTPMQMFGRVALIEDFDRKTALGLNCEALCLDAAPLHERLELEQRISFVCAWPVCRDARAG